ncbi:hypothetical protein M407DRAFT_182193 [Tulasnella calospora MUT 4182]|uniref:Uncharacterized protein n=1 Tax=Tulasnella calospora MUT 4182 TaxID=1051891 RepID=A0A0C3L3V0_9AGAM|nr:hypothetical protein M407DRAFT_182193 [Tulasnella calospora MUT 4182]
MSSVSSGGGKSDIHPSSSHTLRGTRNGDPNPSTMPAPPNKARGRQGKGKKEKPSWKAPIPHEWVPPKAPDPVGLSWGDAAPSWGDDDTPSDNKPSSDSVWDNPALEPNFESETTAEASGWGTEEWAYPGDSANREGEPVDESGFQNGAATEYQNNPNSGNTGWGDGGWVSWSADRMNSAADSGWVESYGTDSYPVQHDQQQNWGEFGGYGSQEGAFGAEVSASWGDQASEPNSHDTTSQTISLGHALQPNASSGFRLNPAASVFVPRNISPPVTVEVTPEQTVSSAAAAEPLSDTTPSTTGHSLPLRSAFDSGLSSTPATCLTDADVQTTDVTEQLLQVDLQVAEYKLDVSQATLEMKKANLDVMRAKLEAMEKRRAMLAGARNKAAK